MKLYIRGKKGAVTLNRNDFIAKGGEGQIYGKGDLIFKLYNDPARMIPDAKIQELRALAPANILKPLDVVLDGKNTPVGFTMKWIRETVALCKLFTNDFRVKNGVTEASTLELVERMKETVRAVHAAGCLMVDGNEFNYLVDKNTLVTPYFIDVDSYQTPNFPATAIMPSIRDRHTQIFSELSDWFSFAVVACQLFVGIHPFKGRHPDFKKNDIESRMKANVSIFHPGVRVPPAARDFSAIPSHYTTWFVALFEKGERMPPPAVAGQIVAVPTPVTTPAGTDHFDIREINAFDARVIWHFVHAGMAVTGTRKAIHIDGKQYPVKPRTEVVFTARQLIPVFARVADGRLVLEAPDAQLAPFPEIEADELLMTQNTLYVRRAGSLIEMAFNELGGKVAPSIKTVWEMMPHASELFDGMIYQNVLGKPYLAIPLPQQDGPGRCIVKAIPELADYRIVDARHDGGVCMMIGHAEGRYDRIVLKFGDAYETYACRVTQDIDLTSVNFVTLEKGIVVSVNDGEADGEDSVDIFSRRPDKPEVRRIRDAAINASMRLCKAGNTVVFFKGKRLYELRMKGA